MAAKIAHTLNPARPGIARDNPHGPRRLQRAPCPERNVAGAQPALGLEREAPFRIPLDYRMQSSPLKAPLIGSAICRSIRPLSNAFQRLWRQLTTGRPGPSFCGMSFLTLLAVTAAMLALCLMGLAIGLLIRNKQLNTCNCGGLNHPNPRRACQNCAVAPEAKK